MKKVCVWLRWLIVAKIGKWKSTLVEVEIWHDDKGEGEGLETPQNDDVIYEQPLMGMDWTEWTPQCLKWNTKKYLWNGGQRGVWREAMFVESCSFTR